MARRATWAPIGTRIVSWLWLATPDKYAGPRHFPSYDDAHAYAEKTHGRVEVDYTLRAPDGETRSVRLWPVPERYQGDAAVGSAVVDRRYELGHVYERDRPAFPTPQEAEDAAGRKGTRTIQERLTFRTPGGDRFEVRGALDD